MFALHATRSAGLQESKARRKKAKGPKGLSFSPNAYDDEGMPSRWQYKTTDKKLGEIKVGSHTVPFLTDSGEERRGTASHLCHNPPCHNPRHLVWESLDNNKSRNWCSGPGAGCAHSPKCLIQGPLFVTSQAPALTAEQSIVQLFEL
jgi:hypothetical protein